LKYRDLKYGGFFLLLPLFASAMGCERSADIPTTVATQGAFTHEITGDGTLQARETTKISVPPEIRSVVRIAWIASEGTVVEEGDLVARFDGLKLEENLASATADLAKNDEDVRKSAAEGETKAGEYRRDFDAATLDLEFSERFAKRDDVVFSEHELIESSIDMELADARRDHAEGMGEVHESLRATEEEILGIERQRAENRRLEASDSLGQLEIRAPHDGILTLVRNWRGETPAVGSELWRGQDVAEIPALDEMEAEIYVLEADAGGLAVGAEAVIRIPAHPEASVRGKIVRVDPVAKPRYRESPVQYFGVGVAVEAEDAGVVKPGQRVTATLVVQELADAILLPRQAVFEEDDRSWVYRRKGSRFESVPVTTGAGTAGRLVVESGVSPGDVIALEEPPPERRVGDRGGAS